MFANNHPMLRKSVARRRCTSPLAATLVASLAALLLLAGCGRAGDFSSEEPLAIRTPLPTFTPTATGDAAGDAAAVAPPGVGGPMTSVDLTASAAAAVESAPVAAPPEQPTAPPTATPAPPPALLLDPPLAVINTELVNSRTGPDTTYPVVMILGRGEEFDITGKNADGTWLRICCVQGQEAWLSAEFVDTDGAIDPLPVAQAGETSPNALATMTATAGPAQIAETLPATPAPAPPSDTPQAALPAPPAVGGPEEMPPPEPLVPEVNLMPADVAGEEVAHAADEAEAAADAAAPVALELAGHERFPETNVVRVFLYVFSGNEALEGYTLRVTKDGVEQAVTGASFGGRPGLTWPIADDRQRFQNLKVEFPGVAPEGVWTIEPLKDGQAAGPAASFTLAAGDPLQELYVRYKRP